MRMDRRSLNEILNDEISYARWRKELMQLRAEGYESITEFLYGKK